MKRGEVYDTRLNPTVGSEQAGTRPGIVISNDTINDTSPVVLVVPCTRYIGQRVYHSQVVLRAPDGGLDVDSVAMAEQVRAVTNGGYSTFEAPFPVQPCGNWTGRC